MIFMSRPSGEATTESGIRMSFPRMASGPCDRRKSGVSGFFRTPPPLTPPKAEAGVKEPEPLFLPLRQSMQVV